MKKIFTTILAISMATVSFASFHLTIETGDEENLTSIAVTKDTTIVVTDYEYDEDLEEATMGVEGMMYSDETENVIVTVTRSTTGIIDQFCAAGNCVPGNEELTQELTFTIGSLETMRRWFTHYTPMEEGEVVISYEFNDGVNPAITLTIQYNYAMTALENVVVSQYNGKVYNLLGQEMPSNNLSELPKGIYIINGKKYIKQ